MRRMAAAFMRLALVVALILGGVWAIAGLAIGPWVTFFALVAAVLGIVVEPWLATKESRRGLLRDLAHELFRNLQVVQDSKLESSDGTFVVYPRVSTAVVEAAFSSGLFSSGSDEKLIRGLHGWHECACDLNHRLDITEAQTASASTEIRQTFQQRLATGRTLRGTRDQLASLIGCLMENYADESGVDSDTVLFSGGADGTVDVPARVPTVQQADKAAPPDHADSGFYAALLSHALHQDALLWSRTQLLTAVQAAILASSYALRTTWLALALLTMGAVLTVLIAILVEKDQRDRDVNQHILDALADRLLPGDLKASLTAAGAQPPQVRISTRAPRWLPLMKGRIIIRLILWGFVAIDVGLVVLGLLWPQLVP